MAKVNLKDATKGLVDEASEILESLEKTLS